MYIITVILQLNEHFYHCHVQFVDEQSFEHCLAKRYDTFHITQLQ